MSRRPARSAPVLACLVLVLAGILGCAEPPRKEMDQAQGAIDAARAAGADEYASAELSAAAAALARAEDAVTQRDYRQALSQALDARERAQAAARDAADRKAEARSAAERDLRNLAASVDTATARLETLRARPPSSAAVAELTAAVDAAEQALQEARAALDRQAFLDAAAVLRAPSERLRAAIAALDEASRGQPAPRQGRRPR